LEVEEEEQKGWDASKVWNWIGAGGSSKLVQLRQPDLPIAAVLRPPLPQPYAKTACIYPPFPTPPLSSTTMTEAPPVVGDTEIFRQLETYPWDKDKEFQVSQRKLFLVNSSPASAVR